MPTGYTSVFQEGKEVTRNDFILRCARAFGALIAMRDEPLDSPLPEKFEPSTYAKESLERAKRQLEHFNTISDEDAEAEMNKEHQEDTTRHEEAVKRENELKIKYQLTLLEIEAWNPPTAEHEELKRFCIKQLTDSIEHDCNYFYYKQKPELQEVNSWIKEKIAFALREVAYFEKEWAEEVKRTEKRNEWLNQLRESL